MIFQKFYNGRQGGTILVDILLALSLSALFASLITEMSFGARSLYIAAKVRNELLTLYEQHSHDFDDLLSYESRSVTTSTSTEIHASVVPYGNDRQQITISVTSDMPYAQPLTFVSVKRDPTLSDEHIKSSPLCSVSFTQSVVVGSYPFLSSLGSNLLPARTLEMMHVETIDLPISPTLPLTDMEVRSNLVYLSSDSSVQSDPDILIVDVHNLANPRLISSINTGPGIAAFTLVGNRIFAAAASTANQLHIIRMDNPQDIFLEKRYQIPLPYATATPPLASSISYSKNKIFLGTEKWDGGELAIIDVGTILSPRYMGGVEMGNKINDVLIRQSSVFVATAGEQQLRVVNASDPSHPSLVNSFSSSGWERQEGRTLSYFEDSLQFGRTAGGFNIAQDHELFNWASTSSVSPFNLDNPQTSDVPDGVYGIQADKHYIFGAGRKPGAELQIYDSFLTGNTSISAGLPSSVQILTCDGDHLYALSHTSPVLYDISFYI